MMGRMLWVAAARTGLVGVLLVGAATGCAKVAPTDQAPPATASGASGSSGFSGTPAASGSSPSGGPSTASSGSQSAGTATGSAASSAASAGASASGSATTSSGAVVPSSSMAPGVKNLALTPELSREILIAAAGYNKLPVTAYTGLMPRATFVGGDGSGTIWAGTALEPSPSSVPAQVSVQDNGSYLLLRHNASGQWTVWAVGVASAADCARLGLPAALRTLWGWPSTGCRPQQ